jgi:hypothetical protein
LNTEQLFKLFDTPLHKLKIFDVSVHDILSRPANGGIVDRHFPGLDLSNAEGLKIYRKENEKDPDE